MGGVDLQGRPCSRKELYTLLKTGDPENDTLSGGMSLYRKYVEYPPGAHNTMGSWYFRPMIFGDRIYYPISSLVNLDTIH